MKIRNIAVSIITSISMFLVPATAFAHVVVTPKQVGVAAFQTFTTSVPNEKDQPMIGLKVIIPSGVGEVTPTVKNGWQVSTKKSGENVTEIDWTGGAVPAGLRDDFTFSAQAPAKASTLNWKAYQTYEDGTVVAWDQAPSSTAGDDDSNNKGPYSETKVINDLATTGEAAEGNNTNNTTGAYLLSGLALVLSLISFTLKRRS